MGWVPINFNKKQHKPNHKHKQSSHSQREKTPWEIAQEQQAREQHDFSAQQTVNRQESGSQRFVEQESTSNEYRETDQMAVAKPPLSNSERIRQRLYLITFALLFWGIYLISPLAKPQQIIVEGSTQTNEIDIVTHSGIATNQTIWSIILGESTISNSLVAFSPKIKQATVTLAGLNSIVLTIDENPAVAYFEKESKAYELLADEQIIEHDSVAPLPVIPRLDQFTDEMLMKKLASQLALVPNTIIQQIERISYQSATGNKNGIVLFMKDGHKVVADLTTLGSRLIYYDQIKKEIGVQRGTIDMEVGIYFTPN